MPKSSAHTLIWSTEKHHYLLHTPGHPPQVITSENEGVWHAWLDTHFSFSFQGQHGHLNVHKEARSRGTGYWYAYHKSASQTHKRYLGRSATITLARLEAVAQLFQGLDSEHAQASSSRDPLQSMQARTEPSSSILQQESVLEGSMVVTRFSPRACPPGW